MERSSNKMSQKLIYEVEIEVVFYLHNKLLREK